MCLLCRKCNSDDHLLRDCDRLTFAERVRFASLILLSDSICSDSEEFYHALDIAQQYESLSGIPAYRIYCDHIYSTSDLLPSTELFGLGDVVPKGLGTAIIRVPIDNSGIFLEYVTGFVNVGIRQKSSTEYGSA